MQKNEDVLRFLVLQQIYLFHLFFSFLLDFKNTVFLPVDKIHKWQLRAKFFGIC